ncbi:MAG: HTTM domain-containing protein [Myxococcota bacterium]
MKLLRIIDNFWRQEVPAARLAMVRVLVGLYGTIYLLVRAPHLWSYGLDDLDRFAPVGIVSLAETPTLPWVYRLLVVLTIALSVPFLMGLRFRILGPLYAGLLLWVLTYTNSWGKILHTDNMLVLYVSILALSPAAEAISWDARGNAIPANDSRFGWPLKLMALLCALVYLLAGIAKLRNSGFGFVDGDTLRNYVAFGNVRKIELGSTHSPLGVWLLSYAGLFSALAWFSLALELGAPLAVLHRKTGKLWSIAVWGFHVGVLALMAIGFVFQLTFVAFAPFFDTERLLERRPFRRLASLAGTPSPEVAGGEKAPEPS